MLSVFFSRLREKLHTAGIMSTHVIFGLDIIVSVVASFFTLLITDLLVPVIDIPKLFLWEWLGLAAVSSAISFFITRIYRIIVRYSTIQDLGRVALACLVKEGFFWAGMLLLSTSSFSPLSGLLGGTILIDFLISTCALSMLRIVVFAIYAQLTIIDAAANKDVKRVYIYGISDKAIAAHDRLRTSTHFRVVGFIVPGKQRRTHEIAGKPVYYIGDGEALKQLTALSGVEGILFPYIGDARSERDNLMQICQRSGIKTYLTPNIDEMSPNAPLNGFVRKIRIEDLLGREEIKISMDEILANLKGKTVLVTGAAGSIGSELCRQLALLGVKHLVLLDNAETPLHYIRLELEDKFPELTFTPVIGDVRSMTRLDYVFRHFRPDIVFHAAAYKHVPLMEENPCEAVLVNVIGSRNVADKCVEYDIEKMVMVSTDKAVNPTNIMGCTKRLAEIYCQSLGLAIEQGKVKGKTRFVTTRFGNVLGSNGSVIPRFRNQIENGGPITVTHPEITRFFMTIPEACRLVMEAAALSRGTEIFIFDMGESVKIVSLAERMIELAGLKVGEDIKIEFTGLRPGEKLYEEVLANLENTLPTSHQRIFIARVREYEYRDAVAAAERLDRLARQVEIDQMVQVMKATVPEFKSKNSQFEKFDR